MILSLLIVKFMKHSTIFNFFQYLMSECLILVHKYDKSVAQYSCPLCTIHKMFMTTECIMSSLLPCSYITLPSVNIHLATGDVTIIESYSPNSRTASGTYYLMLIFTILLLRPLISITNNVCTLLFITINYGNLPSTLMIISLITSCYTCETLLSSP